MQAKLNNLLNKYLSFLSLLFYISGIIYFGLLSDHNFNGKTYFSENALLPGLVDEEFNNDNLADYWYRKVLKFTKNGSISNGKLQKYLLNEMIHIGLDAATQNFTLRYPLIMGNEKAVGQNVYGIVRASRASRTEAVLINVPLREHPSRYSKSDNGEEPDEGTAGALALVLALAHNARSRSYWAKDLIFLFTEMEVTGMQAFLDSYHGSSSSKFLVAGDLPVRSGLLQAGVTLYLEDTSFKAMELRIQGVNGLLPNLDLVNLCVRMADKYGMKVLLHGAVSARNQHTPAAARRAVATLFRFMVSQASGTPAGLSGLLMSYQVPGVTLRLMPVSGGSTRGQRIHGFYDGGRLLEGILRSVNNLLERFHQSFFFYLLPRTDRYISIGLYMPPLGVMAGAPILLNIIHLWFGADRRRPANLIQLLPAFFLMLAAAGTGYLSSTYFVGMSGVFGVDFSTGLFGGLCSLQLAACCYPLLLWRRGMTWLSGDLVDWRLFKCLSLAALLLVLSYSAILNISLAFFAALGMVPGAILVRPIRSSAGRWTVRVVILAGAPLCVSLLVALAATSSGLHWPVSLSPMQAVYSLSSGLLQMAVEQDLIGSYCYRLAACGLWPVWLLVWGVSWIPCDQPTPPEGKEKTN